MLPPAVPVRSSTVAGLVGLTEGKEGVVGGVLIGAVTTVWFTIGGTRDLIRLFRDLAAKKTDMLDDGRVIGHVSADDVALVEKVDQVNIDEAHIEEGILKKELEEEGHEKDDD